MSGIWEVTKADIEQIEEVSRLHQLLQSLLENELAKNRIPISDVSVCLNVTKPDGGEDALVTWKGAPVRTDRIPHQRALFQVKGGHFAIADFKREPFNINRRRPGQKQTKTIKSRVDENLNQSGAYVFFCGGVSFTAGEKQTAEQQIRNALGAKAATSPIVIYGSNDIASWVNEHISAKILVLSWLGKSSLGTYMTWLDWSTRPRVPPDPPWVSSEKAQNRIADIRLMFREPRKVLRLVGQSGLGKSRMIFEAFRPPTSPEIDTTQAVLSGSLVYVFEKEAPQIVEHIAPLVKAGISGTIVVDDCREETHRSLSEWVGQPFSNLSLITIDYQSEEDRTPNTVQIETSENETIAEILRGAGFTGADLDILTAYCDGFPRIAAMLSALSPQDRLNFDQLTPREITKRLVWGREQSDVKATDVLEACSLFAYVGVKYPYTSHMQYVAECLCRISVDEFRQRLSGFIQRGVAQEFGAFIRITPMPLSLKLSQEWIRRHGSDRWKDVISDESMPQDLKNALGHQFEQLGGIAQAAELVKSLTDPNAPFGRAEVLNTVQGSRIFRSFSKVNPEATLSALLREFGSMPLEGLIHVVQGRRSLLWSLATIVFNRELFVPAARLIAKFALAETEFNVANNASGQFKSLFHSLMSGTETPPMARISVADELLESPDEKAIVLGIRAIATAFGITSATRIAGAERQRGTVLVDWQPTTYGQLYEYFEAVLQRLVRFAVRDDEIGTLARLGVSNAIRTLVHYNRFDMTENALREITASYKKAWPEAIASIQSALKYEVQTDGDRLRVQGWLELLRPEDFLESVRLIISKPPVGNIAQNDHGALIDNNEIAARAFIDSLAGDYEKILLAIPVIARGEQLQGFTFGYHSCKTLPDDLLVDYANRCFQALDDAGSDGNPAMLSGVLAAIKLRKPELAAETLDRVAFSKHASRSLVILTATIHPTNVDLDRILIALEARKIDVDSLRRLAYGLPFRDLSPNAVCRFLVKCLAYGVHGAFAALFVVSTYIHTEDQWSSCRALVKKIVLTRGLLEASHVDTMDEYYLEQAIMKILNDSCERATAKRISMETIRICKLKSFEYHSYRLLQPIVFKLLESHQITAWPIFRNALSKAKGLTAFHLRHVMQSNLTMRDAPKSALTLIADETLIEWCEQDPNSAPSIVLSSINLFSIREERIVIAPIVIRLLECYGSDPNVRSALSANLESFSITGSATAAYEQRVKFTKLLMKIPNSDVAAWAAEYSSSFENRLTNQKMRDEEHARGIFTPFFASEIPKDSIDGSIL